VADDKPAAKPPVKPVPAVPGVAVKPGVLILPAPAVPPPLPPGGGFGGGPGGGPMLPPGMAGGYQYGKINLMAGKRAKLPSDTSSSIRVRVAPPDIRNPFGAPASDKAISLMLQVAPEPRLRWQQLKSITIDKAIDDNDQKLTK